MSQSTMHRQTLFVSTAPVALGSLEVGTIAKAADRLPAMLECSDRSYYLRMRDGVRIAISLYFPNSKPPTNPAPMPILLSLTRYGRALMRFKGSNDPHTLDPWINANYVLAIVDVRGTTASFGSRECELGPDEQADMDEIIRHLADLPWSNGKVIATGSSYGGDTADMATTRPAPGLVGAIPREVDFDFYEIFCPGGIPNDRFFKSWAGEVFEMDFGRSQRLRIGRTLDGSKRIADIQFLYPTIQNVDEDPDSKLVFEALRTRAATRPHWTSEDYGNVAFRDDMGSNGHSFFPSGTGAHIEAVRREKKPVQYWGSWMDANTADEAINRYRSAPEVSNVTVITATDHGSGVNADPFFADRTEPFPSQSEQFAMRLAWASEVLAGRPPARVIRYYVLGTGQFRESAEWPPKGIVETEYYLSNGGALQRDIPAVGRNSYDVDFTATSGESNRWFQGPRPRYLFRHEHGSKLLVYRTPGFAEDMELAGWPIVSLEMSASTDDPSVFAYLDDIAPDGTVTYLTEGLIRVIHRKTVDPKALPYDPGPAPHSFERSDALPVVPGEKFLVAFKMFSVAALIEKGHALRLAIAGADAGTFRQLPEVPLSEAPSERFDIVVGGERASKLSLPLKPWR
ncbi:galactose-binding domain-like protein [Naematelia encephala]|uniref:Galactose-binding domain-like protein n=1 Tax=Naematelia encephala TaxID=71784 RepID=A0A1Y2ASP0_9TREE|nr:galactose-binding domain-like protein [Naematelia encephala]